MLTFCYASDVLRGQRNDSLPGGGQFNRIGGGPPLGMQSLQREQLGLQQPLPQHQIPQHLLQQQQQLASHNRLNSLYDSNRLDAARLDDRNFVPDGMVPGLRTAPPPSRSRDGGMFEGYDDINPPIVNPPMRSRDGGFGIGPGPQQRVAMEQPYSAGPSPGLYSQQPGMGRMGMPLQQPPPFRGGPSPLGLHNGPPPLGQRNLPPGLANLGGRPPHEPSHMLGGGGPMMNPGGMHAGPQQFNNSRGMGFNGPPPRGIPPNHGVHNSIGHGGMGGVLGHPNNLELRGLTQQQQAQLLGLGGPPGPGGLRAGPGFGGMQGPDPQLQALRQQQMMRQQQQQQQHLQQQLQQHHPAQQHHPQHLSHMGPQQMLPPHLQQPHNIPPSHNQPGTQDLMELLMGGPHRD